MQKQLTAAERYRAAQPEVEAEIVDVIPPSGFVFQFKKPSAFGILFGIGGLPAGLASQAIEKWREEGVVDENTFAEGTPGYKLIQTTLRVRDQVLEQSHSPKLVVGLANEGNDELSTSDVSDADLAFLMQWVMGGGQASAELANFSGRSDANAVASGNRKERRAKAKRSSGGS